ncbi:FkbM family methyltransferase [Sabulicella glaciei]|uniref:FkbM family methyltransferase n=1 Tax=Sabulicella glaciei TaxID=2984948 RepID=A0ABT3NSN0_9PROT|nr:FkbM family methyltransferase [Roseococcus sp. MDT2-1-1]MCW8085157.1 FkbM family methyltransferase [Roseococcus sp. MDT2-1-1]
MSPRLPPSLLQILSRHNYPGKHRLFRILRDAGLLRSELRFELGGIALHAPAEEWNFWRLRDARLYDPDVDALGRFAQARLGSFDLLDLGADVGMVSRLIHAACPELRSITAVEPNPASFGFLRRNLEALPLPTRALNLAVSDKPGEAVLAAEAGRRSDHAAHLRTEGAGLRVTVERVDAIFSPVAPDLLLKLDVEGEEAATLRGAERTLRRPRRAVLFMEIHPEVLRRGGGSAEALFAAAEAIRPCRWFLADAAATPVDRALPFFQQVPERQHDVIGLMDEQDA